eukprot:XP_001695518.1 predicted protein [Chlamydomonas reinhardtii]
MEEDVVGLGVGSVHAPDSAGLGVKDRLGALGLPGCRATGAGVGGSGQSSHSDGSQGPSGTPSLNEVGAACKQGWPEELVRLLRQAAAVAATAAQSGSDDDIDMDGQQQVALEGERDGGAKPQPLRWRGSGELASLQPFGSNIPHEEDGEEAQESEDEQAAAAALAGLGRPQEEPGSGMGSGEAAAQGSVSQLAEAVERLEGEVARLSKEKRAAKAAACTQVLALHKQLADFKSRTEAAEATAQRERAEAGRLARQLGAAEAAAEEVPRLRGERDRLLRALGAAEAARTQLSEVVGQLTGLVAGGGGDAVPGAGAVKGAAAGPGRPTVAAR